MNVWFVVIGILIMGTNFKILFANCYHEWVGYLSVHFEVGGG